MYIKLIIILLMDKNSEKFISAFDRYGGKTGPQRLG